MGKSILGSIGYRIVHGGKLIPTVKRTSFPKGSTAKSDNTGQDNPNGRKSRDVGWKDIGDLTLTINDPGGALYAELYALWLAGTKEIWTFQRPPLSSGRAMSGQAFISGIEPKVADDGGPQTIELAVTPTLGFDPLDTPAAGLTNPFLTVTDEDSHALTLSPAVSGSAYDYACTAYSTSTSVTITPTAAAGAIYVDGVLVASGSASGAITLDAGVGNETLIGIVVTEINKGPRSYLVRVVMGDAPYSA